ncbi:MAG: glycosyltransferase [Planctomycetota bacterium]
MSRLVALSTLPREGPSVRPRVLDYEPALREAGVGLKHLPLLSSRTFSRFYSRRRVDRARKVLATALGYPRRAAHLGSLEPSDGVLVHREIVPRGNRRFLRRLERRGIRYAYDLDDAIYLSPRDYVGSGELSRRRMATFKDPAEVNDLIAGAALVLAGNPVIAEHAARLCDDVRVQPTPVDTDRFRPREKSERERPLVGWIGSPTAAYCLKDIAGALTRAAAEVPFDLLVVGAGEPVAIDGVRVIDKDWSLGEEPFDYAALDVGLYPLPDNDWTRAKCGMKALLYMASGAPSILSPVGVNRDIVSDGRTGLFATTEAEWTESLLTYLGDPEMREAAGAAGREEVVSHWSVSALAEPFVAAIREVLP